VWIRQGLIRQTEGNVVDYDVIRRDIGELAKLYRIRELAYRPVGRDAARDAAAGRRPRHGPVPPGLRIAQPSGQGLREAGPRRQLRHGGNPVLRWMASNVAIETDAAGNIKPSKRRSTERIDGIVATVMALGRAVVAQGDGRSVYAERGIDIL
jgi:phage terminase large subunit-like protein